MDYQAAFKFEFIPNHAGKGDSERATCRASEQKLSSENRRNDESPSQKELREQQQAEQQKKQELYYPDQECPDKGESGCTYPDCDNCEVDWGNDDDWEGDFP